MAGLIFYDANGNDTADNSDWALSGAEVVLSKSGSDTKICLYTGTDGSYKFTDLPVGIYTVSLILSDSDSGTNSLGTLLDSSGSVVSTGRGTVGTDTFTGIDLESGYSGENYNFSQLSYPASLVTKRLLTNINPGLHHITVTPSPVPEPGTMALLVVGGLCIGGMAWRRRRGCA
ncbi:MAG: SdrD B-like domain-containing protein [Thermoguttaceae bacterium]